MSRFLVPLLAFSILAGVSGLLVLPVGSGHIGLTAFAMFCVVVPGYICHLTIGYFLARFKTLYGGRYEKPGWWLDLAVLDRGFLRDVYRLVPSTPLERRMKMVFAVSLLVSLLAFVIALVLANLYPAPI
jgi:hypothetical protein